MEEGINLIPIVKGWVKYSSKYLRYDSHVCHRTNNGCPLSILSSPHWTLVLPRLLPRDDDDDATAAFRASAHGGALVSVPDLLTQYFAGNLTPHCDDIWLPTAAVDTPKTRVAAMN